MRVKCNKLTEKIEKEGQLHILSRKDISVDCKSSYALKSKKAFKTNSKRITNSKLFSNLKVHKQLHAHIFSTLSRVWATGF